MQRFIISVGILMLACLAAGCGGAEESASTPLTKAQFIKQADRICATSSKKRDAAAALWTDRLPGGASEAEARLDDAFKEVVAPSMQREAKDLEALPPPEADAAKVSRMIGNLAEAGSLFAEEGSKGLSRSDLPAFEKEANAYGLKVCPNPY
jgi:hypothetical protein